MNVSDIRANLASLRSRRTRLWVSTDDELARLDRERAALIQARDEETLELDSEIGDETAALEALEEAEYVSSRWSGVEMWRALG